MDKAAQVKALLKEIIGAVPFLPILGEVTAVSGETCSVKIASGLELTDVKLKATINGNTDYLLLTPVIGSTVMMLSNTGTLENMTVIKVDQAQKMEYAQGGLKILADGTDGKVSIKNNDTSLKDIFEDQATFLQQLKVSTSTGPSGTPLPDTIQAIVQWKVKFNKLIK